MRCNKTLSTSTLRRLQGRSLLLGLAALAWGATAQAQSYCAASGPGSTYTLCSFSFADINTVGAVGTPYVDYTGTVGSVVPGQSYTMAVNATDAYGWGISAFFDWDANGSFETRVDVGMISGACPGSPMTGTINVPGSAVNGTSRMRIISSYNGYTPGDACGYYDYGQTLDYTLLVGPPPTCLAPTAPLVSNIGTTTADLSWTASTSAPANGYQWEVRASGNPGDPSPDASGTTAAGVTATSASGLTAGIATYKLYVRADCGGGDLSAWKASSAFETGTILACGSTWVSPGGSNNLTDVAFIRTYTICPSTSGDVATLDFTTWNGLNWNVPQKSGIFIYNGDNTSAPQIMGPGAAYSETGWSIPAGGWTSANTTNKPPITTSTAANGCLTIKVYSFGIWTGGMGWSADITCAPAPTCFPPTAISTVSTSTGGGTFSFTGTSASYEYKVVASGAASTATAIVSGTMASSPVTITGLTAGTPYTAYFRGDCGSGDLSAWSPVGKNFRTVAGCGGPVDLYSSAAYAAYTPIPTGGRDSTVVICPDLAGDVVTLNLTKFSFGSGGNGAVGVFVHNGNSTAAPIFDSGLPAKVSGANTLPAGAYWGDTYRVPGPGVLPGPFTSTAANGCLTVRFRAFASSTYDQGMTSNVTCAPAPACSTPDNVTFSNIGSTSVTVSWANASQPAIIEYGPVGFTPGTGAAAGTNGTVISGALSGQVITGLSTATTYNVFVRQVCTGPTYSANSFLVRFSTSIDCSAAEVLTCGTPVTANIVYGSGNSSYANSYGTSCTQNLNGPERLYKITAPVSGSYQLQIDPTSPQQYTSTTIGFLTAPATGGCGAANFSCIRTFSWDYYGTLSGGATQTFTLTAGDHYILMDPAGSMEGPVTFQINCPGIPSCIPAPTYPPNNGTLALNSNPIVFTWPAAFGATSYDVYFNGALVANTPTNSINGGSSYTTANVAALFGIGNAATWRAVPKNADGTATCATNWTFRVGGNGAANAVPLTEGVVSNGNRRATNGYTSLESSYWGTDFWHKLTVSACADSVALDFCITAGVGGNYGYASVVVRRASDNAIVLNKFANSIYAGDCMILSEFDYDWYYAHNTDPDYEDRYILSKPTFLATPGETYYVITDGYTWQNDYTMAYTEISLGEDSDGDGIPDCADDCPFTPGVEGGACTIPGFSVGKIINCECVGGNMAVVSITADSNPTELTWEITNETMAVIASGAPTAGQANTVVSETVFLPGSCYSFQLMDSNGDGITSGGWELRTTGGKLLLRDDFASGSVSPATPAANPNYGSGHSFCLPEGPANIAPTECGIFNNLLGNKVYANKVTGAANYQFEFSDPDAGFMRRIARPYNYVHFWDMVTNPLVPGVKYFARVRTDRDGPMASAHFGSGCEMGLATAVVTCSELIQAPAYGHSCNETRSFNTNNSFIYAKPVQGATEYQFRIFNTSEGYDQIFTRSTYILQMKWNPNVAPLLQDGYTYNVEINVKVNGVYSGFCASSCTISIDNSGNRPEASITQAVGQEADQQMGVITMWPNPVRDGQVNLNIDGIVDADQQISVTIVDLYGKQVFAQEFGNNGDRFNTILNLNSDIASGVYLVSINVNGTNTVQRLSIIR